MLERNKNYRTSIDGKLPEPSKIWETEESVSLCIVSQYWKDFSDVLINLVKEYGVTYFKWDAIGQGDCDNAGHDHGTAENPVQERRDNDAFLLPIYMSKIIDKVSKACPEAIFDFDITEDGRAVGLSFLSSGKYFAINNGPYYHNYNISEPWKTPLANGNRNIFVYPGPARGWFTRQILTYDKWIPSVLFLTHYQPDEPRNSQVVNIASLILGQNGIWGEILKTSPEGTLLFDGILKKYKQLSNDITLASPLCYGTPGESSEIHEKINPATGKGVVVIFGNGYRKINYITKSKVNQAVWHNDGVSVSYDGKGRAIIKASFTETSAKIIFFGLDVN
jgi:alpha-galactosidase